MSRAADATKRASIKITSRFFSGSFNIPVKKAKGTDDKNGNANLRDRYPALAKLKSAMPATTMFNTREIEGIIARLIPTKTNIAM